MIRIIKEAYDENNENDQILFDRISTLLSDNLKLPDDLGKYEVRLNSAIEDLVSVVKDIKRKATPYYGLNIAPLYATKNAYKEAGLDIYNIDGIYNPIMWKNNDYSVVVAVGSGSPYEYEDNNIVCVMIDASVGNSYLYVGPSQDFESSLKLAEQIISEYNKSGNVDDFVKWLDSNKMFEKEY